MCQVVLHFSHDRVIHEVLLSVELGPDFVRRSDVTFFDRVI
jgi:hypothetical protein